MVVKRKRCTSFFFFSQSKLMLHFVPVITFFKLKERYSQMSTNDCLIDLNYGLDTNKT